MEEEKPTKLETVIEIILAVIAAVLIISLFVVSIYLLAGCAPKQPSSHEDWAAYCMSKKDSEFRQCLDDWNHWEKCPVE